MFARYPFFKTEGILIAEKKIQDADAFLTFFTYEFGLKDVLAKGVSRSKAKLRSATMLFGEFSVEFIKGKRYAILTDVSPIKAKVLSPEKFLRARAIANYLAEVLKGEQKDVRIWDLLKECFANIEYEVVLPYFKLKLLGILGYKPRLKQCVICGEEFGHNERVYFSFDRGGALCKSCAAKSAENMQIIDPATISALQWYEGNNFDLVKTLKIPKISTDEVFEIVEKYSRFYP